MFFIYVKEFHVIVHKKKYFAYTTLLAILYPNQ